MIDVVFMGGKAVGHGCLSYLINNPLFSVNSVFINPDSDLSDDRWYPSVFELSTQHNIPVYSKHDINSDDSINLVTTSNPDFIVVVYYDQILKKKLLAVPKIGCVNLHLAKAEEYRGCFPTTWAIINGETETGVTLHIIDEGIDSGPILAESIVPIDENDTGRSLYDKCTEAGIKLFEEHIFSSLTCFYGRPQVTNSDTKYYSRNFPSHEIKFEGDANDVFNRIRALIFPPFPNPYFYIGNKKIVLTEENYNSFNPM